MKRFITYLYQYKELKKSNNTGFIKVESQSKITRMMIVIKSQTISGASGKVYLIFEDTVGILLGEIKMGDGEIRQVYEFDTEKREIKSLHIKLFDYIVKKIEEEAMTYVAVVNMTKVNNQNNCSVPDLGITCKGKDLFDCLYHAEQEILAIAEKRKLQNIIMPKPTMQKDINCNEEEIKVSIVVSTEKMGDNNANTLPKKSPFLEYFL